MLKFILLYVNYFYNPSIGADIQRKSSHILTVNLMNVLIILVPDRAMLNIDQSGEAIHLSTAVF